MYNYYDFLCHGKWNPKRGIRQGDPYLLMFFIICAESLGRYIYYRATILKTGIGVKAAKHGPMIPILCLLMIV